MKKALNKVLEPAVKGAAKPIVNHTVVPIIRLLRSVIPHIGAAVGAQLGVDTVEQFLKEAANSHMDPSKFTVPVGLEAAQEIGLDTASSSDTSYRLEGISPKQFSKLGEMLKSNDLEIKCLIVKHIASGKCAAYGSTILAIKVTVIGLAKKIMIYIVIFLISKFIVQKLYIVLMKHIRRSKEQRDFQKWKENKLLSDGRGPSDPPKELYEPITN